MLLKASFTILLLSIVLNVQNVLSAPVYSNELGNVEQVVNPKRLPLSNQVKRCRPANGAEPDSNQAKRWPPGDGKEPDSNQAKRWPPGDGKEPDSSQEKRWPACDAKAPDSNNDAQ